MRKLIKDKFPQIKTLVSYQDTEVHLGTIYKADNWTKVLKTAGGAWSSLSRKRKKVQSSALKIRWEYKI